MYLRIRMAEKKKFLENSAEYFHTLHLVYYLMVSVPLILFCVIYLRFMAEGGLTGNFSLDGLHAFFTLGTVLSGTLAYWAYRQRFRHYDATEPFRQRLRFFHRAAWVKYLWLGVANLLPVAGLYLTREQFFVGLYAVALILFSLNRPTLRRVVNDLRLSTAERERLTGNQDFDPK